MNLLSLIGSEKLESGYTEDYKLGFVVKVRILDKTFHRFHFVDCRLFTPWHTVFITCSLTCVETALQAFVKI